MARIANITFACEDPERMARFWSLALGYVIPEMPDVVAQAIASGDLDPKSAAVAEDPKGVGPRLFFERKTKGTARPMPLHLDLHAEDMHAEVERLENLGATKVEERSRAIGPYIETWVYMRDPEGNGFCVQ